MGQTEAAARDRLRILQPAHMRIMAQGHAVNGNDIVRYLDRQRDLRRERPGPSARIGVGLSDRDFRRFRRVSEYEAVGRNDRGREIGSRQIGAAFA